MIRSVSAFLLMALAFAACSPNNVTEDKSLEKYFKDNKVTGSFGMFDNGQGHFTLSNISQFTDSMYLPASTFKIINSLIGLETGAVQDSASIIPFDSTRSYRAECKGDMNMYNAFRISCPNWYQELADEIGKPAMQKWLDTLGYGQRKERFVIGNNLDTFWLDNSVKVTGDEQLGLVKKLYFDQLPFSKRSQRIVRNMMLWENNSNYQLAYKTGWGTDENQHQIGWIIGWIEENKHPYFFSLQVKSPDAKIDMPAVRLNILKGILAEYGFMDGKK
ncbi:penicillin-binding transpeptidase domain-containing protein [Pseudobacter ginsenosidimutans]|uniref:beta-lactamase n=1 Tax=Pseudobacter ginsenosidimutans TaxID=661488 RepID=A0A4Q7MTJ5_9BACT|nr:penicillin-binding transpeptidase domain-containing protein [Pseudobacter ginsenosidimutans]QEC41078.1 class D beta-lactamase [Pseudobacter ginsenosidimutans]RZS72165.1 beta-lactamase class D [Pseudobacter ginsenosidimutans]